VPSTTGCRRGRGVSQMIMEGFWKPALLGHRLPRMEAIPGTGFGVCALDGGRR